MRKIVLRFVVLFSLVLLSSCSSPNQDLRKRATDFYNIFTGATKEVTILDFLLPQVRARAREDEGIALFKKLQEALSKVPSGKVKPIEVEEVSVRISGNFGVSWIATRRDKPITQAPAIKWAKVGSNWYLFYGPKEVLDEIGVFPEELIPEEEAYPRLPALKERAKERERRLSRKTKKE